MSDGTILHHTFDPGQTRIIDYIAGPFADQVLRIWRSDRIAEYLCAPDARRHVWHACFSSKAWRIAEDEGVLARLTSLRSRQLIESAWESCPPGMLSALAKLGPVARRTDFYRDLWEVLELGGDRAKLLWFSSAIEDAKVHDLARLKVGERWADAADTLLKHGVDPRDVKAIVWMAQRIHAVSPETDLRHLFRRKSGQFRLLTELTLALPFPEAPWPASAELKPVTSAKELRELASSGQNCLMDPYVLTECAVGVQSGQEYFYVWSGEHPALVMFSRASCLGWVVRQIEGLPAKGFDRSKMQQVRAAVAQIPLVFPPDDPRWPFNLNANARN